MYFELQDSLKSKTKGHFLSLINSLFFNYPKNVFFWDAEEDVVLLNDHLKQILLLDDIFIPPKIFRNFLDQDHKNLFSEPHLKFSPNVDIYPPSRFEKKYAKLSFQLQWIVDSNNALKGILGVEHTDSRLPLSRVFAIANQFQKVALRSKSRKKILKTLCQLLVKEGKFLLAWIGQADFQKNRVIPICWSGKGDYLRKIKITLDDAPTGKGPTATAIKTNTVFTCRDTENDPLFAPWREEAISRGFLSTLAFPFQDELGNKLALNLYANEKFHFDKYEIQLIEHLVNDLKFALEVQQKKKALQESLHKLEREHWKTTQFLSTSLDGFLLIDEQGIIRDVNPAYCSISGYGYQELVGKSIAYLETEKTQAEVDVNLQGWFRQKQGRYVTVHRTKTGDTLQLEVSYCLIESENRKYIATFMRNITPEKKLIQQLEKSEKQYRDLVENSPFIYGIMQNDHIVYLNRTGKEILDRIFEKPILGKHKKYLLTSEEYKKSQERMKKLMAGEHVNYPVEIKIYDANGNPWYFELYVFYSNIQDTGNVHFILIDISERKKSQQSLVRKDRILEAVGFAATEFLNNDFDHADIQKVLATFGQATEADRVYIFRNHTDESGNLLTSQLYEWVAEGISRATDFKDLENIPYVEAGFERWANELSRGRSIIGNIDEFPESERSFLAAQKIQSILIVPIFVEQKWWGFIGFDNCTTQLQWSPAEVEALRVAANLIGASLNRMSIEKDRNLLAQALKNIHDGVAITDLEYKIIYTNQAFRKIFGYQTPELAGHPLNLFFDVENMTTDINDIFTQTLTQGWQGEVFCKRQDGSPFTGYLSTASIKDPQNNPTALIFIIRDISEYKTLQQQLQQAQKMEAVGRLAGGVAHDFNNLLTIINGYSQLLLAQVPPDAPFHTELKQIYAAGERASELTNQLLAFSRQQMVNPRVYSINALVHEMEKMIRRIIGEDIKIITHFNEKAGNIRTDRGQFQQVLLNLVINARDAMPNGGELILETGSITLDEQYVRQHPGSRIGHYTYLRVRDTGIGIPKENLAHIFEPFFTTKAKGKGTGLGLATVYGIVKQNKGYIWVESTPGKGTTFDILFPTVKAPVSQEKKRSTQLPAIPSPKQQYILVVEDDSGVRELITNILSTAGYKILEAQNGQEALEILHHHYPGVDLIISDIIMPEMSGFDLGKKIKQRYPGVKMLFMSGYSQELTKNSALKLTRSNFLKKPFTPADLLKKINRIFKEPTV